MVAIKDKMDLAVTIAIGSSIQVALFVAPLLVLAGHLLGQPIDLHFSLLELIAVVVAVAVMALVSNDGETHWLEGALLLAVYVIIALAFYHSPTPAQGHSAAPGKLECRLARDRAVLPTIG
jgi:Ca2+:H+ antiporter